MSIGVERRIDRVITPREPVTKMRKKYFVDKKGVVKYCFVR